MKPSSGGESSTDMVAEGVRYADVGGLVVVVVWALVDYQGRRCGDRSGQPRIGAGTCASTEGQRRVGALEGWCLVAGLGEERCPVRGVACSQ